VGLRACLDDVECRKTLPLPTLEMLTLCRPARSQSLYRLQILGVKRIGREAGHLPPSSAQVNVDLYLHSLMRLHGAVLN
jgi:hypothetical protein